jgi:hypothetical protein
VGKVFAMISGTILHKIVKNKKPGDEYYNDFEVEIMLRLLNRKNKPYK